MHTPSLRFGTSTWNYDSWVGLVYKEKHKTAAEYLAEYARQFKTAEIDSWFYHIPKREEVIAYKEAVSPDFRFTAKVPQQICLTHFRPKKKEDPLVPNPDFLSVDLFNHFLKAIEPLLPQIDGLMFEFEYLNKLKMASLAAFLDHLGPFVAKLPVGLPYALEPRNQNYLKKSYFEFVSEKKLIHVLSERQFLPPIYEVYQNFEAYFGDTIIIRLLGGDRREIETLTGEKWDKIVLEKPELPEIARMLNRMMKKKAVTINVNNHYEGSAPITIQRLEELRASLASEKSA